MDNLVPPDPKDRMVPKDNSVLSVPRENLVPPVKMVNLVVLALLERRETKDDEEKLVPLDLPAFLVSKELLVLMDPRATADLKVPPVIQVFLESLEKLVFLVFKENKVPMVIPVKLVPQDLKENPVSKDPLVDVDSKVPSVCLVKKAAKEPRENLVVKELLVPLVNPDNKVNPVKLETTESAVCPDLPESPVYPDPPVPMDSPVPSVLLDSRERKVTQEARDKRVTLDSSDSSGPLVRLVRKDNVVCPDPPDVSVPRETKDPAVSSVFVDPPVPAVPLVTLVLSEKKVLLVPPEKRENAVSLVPLVPPDLLAALSLLLCLRTSNPTGRRGMSARTI